MGRCFIPILVDWSVDGVLVKAGRGGALKLVKLQPGRRANTVRKIMGNPPGRSQAGKTVNQAGRTKAAGANQKPTPGKW